MPEEIEKISEQEVSDVLQVWDFLNFANTYRNSYYSAGYNTPDAINQQMQNVNMNPTTVSVEEIERALKNPKKSEDILRDYAMSLENENMFYKRLLRYMSGLPSFNLTFDCINIEKSSDYTSEDFKSDLKVLEDFCNKFDFKEQFGMVVRQLFRQGVFFSVLRDDGSRYILQELPAKFSKITGRFDYGLLYDFDFNWFLSNYGVDINMYPKVFKKMYRQVFSNMNKEYNASLDTDRRISTFSYWHQCSPEDGFWAWKISPEIATIIPYFAPLFPDIAMQPVVRGLQEDKYFIEASKLLVGIIGFNKDNKSGNVANQINMSPEMLGKFLGVARQGLKKQIGLTALPLDSVETVEFNTKDRNMLTEHVKNITNQSTASSATLLDENKLSVHQSKLASAIDNNLLRELYPMFERFVEFFVNAKTKKFKFKVKFNDFNTPDDINQRLSLLQEFSSKGATNWELMARINDKNIFEYKKQIILENSMFKDVPDLFVPLTNIYTQSGKDGGRPQVKNPENENTVASQERESDELSEE